MSRSHPIVGFAVTGLCLINVSKIVCRTLPLFKGAYGVNLFELLFPLPCLYLTS